VTKVAQTIESKEILSLSTQSVDKAVHGLAAGMRDHGFPSSVACLVKKVPQGAWPFKSMG
jgi:hypothetical protein